MVFLGFQIMKIVVYEFEIKGTFISLSGNFIYSNDELYTWKVLCPSLYRTGFRCNDFFIYDYCFYRMD